MLLEAILDKKHIDAENKSFSYPSGTYKVDEMNNPLKSNLPGNVSFDFIAKDLAMKIVMFIENNKDKLLKIIENIFFIQN